MPSHLLPKFIKRLDDVEKSIVAMQVEQKWFKWILVGAAGMGLLEKIFGWIVK